MPKKLNEIKQYQGKSTETAALDLGLIRFITSLMFIIAEHVFECDWFILSTVIKVSGHLGIQVIMRFLFLFVSKNVSTCFSLELCGYLINISLKMEKALT